MDTEYQPPKKLIKGGSLARKRQTPSLTKINHSCIRNALLKMVKDALNNLYFSVPFALFDLAMFLNRLSK
jgi:hypothetical protein